MLWILIALVVILAIPMFTAAMSFLRGVKRVRAAERTVRSEMAAVEGLTTDEAAQRADSIVREHALTHEWGGPLPSDVAATLDELDATLVGLFRRYRRIRLRQTGTELSSDLLSTTLDVPHGMLMIGMNQVDGYTLCVKPRSSTIYEVRRGRATDEFASIWHYILQVENET